MNKTYYERNKEKIKQKQNLYIKNNKEKVLKQKREWARKHRAELREKGLIPPTKKQLQERIDKAIEILKNEDYIDNLPYIDDEVSDKRKLDYWFEVADKLDDKRLEALEILGNKE